MPRNRYIAVSVGVTALLTVAIIASFTLFADSSASGQGQMASVTVAVLQIASVMVVAALALSRARTRAFGWESIAAAFALTLFVISAGAWGVGSDIAMILRPPIGLVGILAFTLFDTGRPVTRIDRLVTVPAALAGIVLGLLLGLTATVTAGAWAALPCTNGCAEYGLGLIGTPWWNTAIQVVFTIVQVTAMAGCIVGLAQRKRAARGWRNTVLWPVAWFGGAYAAIGILLTLPVLGGLSTTLPAWVDGILIIRRLLLPLAIGAGMVMSVILQRQAARTGLATLRDAATLPQVQDAVQRLMADPEVTLLPIAGVAADGAAPTGFVHTDIRLADGYLLGVLRHRPVRDDEEQEVLDDAVPAAALALDRLRTRERLATASDAERARIERDLHDGVQQHLVAMRMRLGLLESQMQDGPADTREGVEDLIVQSEVALDELRQIARGEHLGLLGRQGLRGAMEQVAARTDRDVRLAGVTGERLPAPIEEALYFTFREALQNAMKHGDQQVPIVVAVRPEGADVVFEFSDVRDTRAPETAGSTARTIAERTDGLGGIVRTYSSASGGRRICGRIPLSGVREEAADDRR